MSREILPLQREAAWQAGTFGCKTTLDRFNHASGLAVNSFTPNHPIYSHCNATKTELLSCPPALRASGIPKPGAVLAGMDTLTWYNPTQPGAKPAKSGASSVPFNSTVTGAFVRETCPLRVTAPSPVA